MHMSGKKTALRSDSSSPQKTVSNISMNIYLLVVFCSTLPLNVYYQNFVNNHVHLVSPFPSLLFPFPPPPPFTMSFRLQYKISRDDPKVDLYSKRERKHMSISYIRRTATFPLVVFCSKERITSGRAKDRERPTKPDIPESLGFSLIIYHCRCTPLQC